MIDIADRLNWEWKLRRHARIAREVLATPPAVPRDDGVLLLSMIGAKTLLPYLVAAKSLHDRLGRGRFVVVDDGTLSDADRTVLAEQLGRPEIVPIGSIDTGTCPRGGTWERLLTILDRRRDHFVIQFDSDTVTTGPMPEVAEAIAAGRSFSLAGDADAARVGIVAAPAFAGLYAPDHSAPAASAHVQARIEAALARVQIRDLRYLRGCSGFAGFAPGGGGRTLAERFSREAERLLGRDKWRDWGSEQVTSSMVVANDPDAAVLPYARYTNFWNAPVAGDVALVHFIGTYRFHGNAYLDATRAAITRLHAAATRHVDAA